MTARIFKNARILIVDDEPVNVKPVETVSAMDLIMGAAEEDSAKQGEDEGPASA